jgi:hypothetical protein
VDKIETLSPRRSVVRVFFPEPFSKYSVHLYRNSQRNR